MGRVSHWGRRYKKSIYDIYNVISKQSYEALAVVVEGVLALVAVEEAHLEVRADSVEEAEKEGLALVDVAGVGLAAEAGVASVAMVWALVAVLESLKM